MSENLFSFYQLKFIIILNFMLFNVSYSCTFPPEIKKIPYVELISTTKNIVLARVVNAKDIGDRRVNYTIETIEQIKGKSDQTFKIEGSILTYPHEASDFNSHSDEDFWQGEGRAYNNTMCNIKPSFAVGQKYLIFINPWERNHVKSFELILSSNDLWYKKVKEFVK